MPTTRTRRTRKITTLTLDQLTYPEIYALVKQWRPPIAGVDHGHARWRTWADYFRDYALVRAELLDALQDGDRLITGLCAGREPFAERIRDEIHAEGPGALYDAHRHEARQHSHIYKRRDAHEHGDTLGPAIELEANR